MKSWLQKLLASRSLVYVTPAIGSATACNMCAHHTMHVPAAALGEALEAGWKTAVVWAPSGKIDLKGEVGQKPDFSALA
jgi:hypothetical protein